MSKEKIEAYLIKCDKCGEYYDDGVMFESTDKDFFEERMVEDGWQIDGDKHYCPECAKPKEVAKHIKLY